MALACIPGGLVTELRKNTTKSKIRYRPGSCLCHEHITNSVIGVSQPPVLDCGTTFHLDSGGRDLPSTLSDNL